MPPHVTLCEVGPRDGFQFESTPIPTARKVDWIGRLAQAGLPRIQATSFVHPKWVPQMADAEDVIASLPAVEGCIYSALALNERGVDRALRSGVEAVDLSIATHEQHARDNVNMTVDEGADRAETMVRMAREAGREVQLNLQTVWGYAEAEDVPLETVARLAGRFHDLGVDTLSLADSTGRAHPLSIRRRIEALRQAAPGARLVLHLHDTRGAGLANVAAALEAGVDWFDTSLGGLGGCPFIPGATGNVATEDTAALLHAMDVPTGVDEDAVSAVTREVADFLGRRLAGKVYTLGA
jgi:hydroxymethylglutaryl-CoA lyase